MNPSYLFRATAHWTDRRQGIVEGEPPAPAIAFSAPPEFQGEPGFWTPEHFLLASVSGCFITTFRAIAELSKFSFDGLTVAVEGQIEKAEDGLRFTQIVLQPILRIGAAMDRERAIRLLEKAERSCLIARSLKAAVSMKPMVEIAAPAQAAAA